MKTGFFITARLKSSRLKNKILLDLNGKTILDHVIERCKIVAGVDDVVLCTSTNSQDSILYDFALKHKIKFFAGSEVDVLKRLSDAAEYYQFDAFLSITADNPLHSFHIARLMLDSYKKETADFIYTKGLPIGIAPYMLNSNAVKVAIEMKQNMDTEIWGPFINRPDFFNVREFFVKNSPYDEKYRLTCDYPNDYKLIRNLTKLSKSTNITIHETIEILQEHSYLWDINKSVEQVQVNAYILKKIRQVFNENEKVGEKFAQKINKRLDPNFEQITIEL